MMLSIGLGKTLETCLAILVVLEKAEASNKRDFSGPVLIIAPKDMISTWQKELERAAIMERPLKVLRLTSEVRDLCIM